MSLIERMMRSGCEAPSVDSINFQVRTGISVPFAPHMRGEKVDAPKADSINFQVRTGISVPFDPDMVEPKAEAPRTTTVPFASFMVK